MRIGEVARLTGLPAKTIRYYEAIGLIAEPAREATSGYRSYTDADVTRLRFIAGAKQLGLALDEISDILGATDQVEVSCPHVVTMLETKRDRVEDWIRNARALVDVLDATIESSQRLVASASASAASCPVIEHGLHQRALALADTPDREPRALILFSAPIHRTDRRERPASVADERTTD